VSRSVSEGVDSQFPVSFIAVQRNGEKLCDCWHCCEAAGGQTTDLKSISGYRECDSNCSVNR
jgi:hypothetical protein